MDRRLPASDSPPGSVYQQYEFPSEWGEVQTWQDDPYRLVPYSRRLVIDYQEGFTSDPMWLDRVGQNSLSVPILIAYRLWLTEGNVHAGRAMSLGTNDEMRDSQIHSILLMDALEEAMPEEWLLELVRLRLTNEAALRVIEIRHSREELRVLSDSTAAANKSAKNANRTALIALVIGLLSTIVLLLQMLGFGEPVDVNISSLPDRRAEPPSKQQSGDEAASALPLGAPWLREAAGSSAQRGR